MRRERRRSSAQASAADSRPACLLGVGHMRDRRRSHSLRVGVCPVAENAGHLSAAARTRPKRAAVALGSQRQRGRRCVLRVPRSDARAGQPQRPKPSPWPTTRTTTSSWPATRRAARTATAARSTGGTACGPRTTRTSWRACASRTTPGRTSSRTATRTTTATIMRRGGRGRRRRRRPSGLHKGATTTTSWSRSSGSWPRSCTARSSSTRPWRSCSTASASWRRSSSSATSRAGSTSSASRPSCRAWRRARSCGTRRRQDRRARGPGTGTTTPARCRASPRRWRARTGSSRGPRRTWASSAPASRTST